MKILIIGADGYLGFPLACRLSTNGNDVLMIDNYSKRLTSNEFRCDPLFCADGFETRVSKVFELTGMDTSLSYEFIDAKNLFALQACILDFEPQVIINCTMPVSDAHSIVHWNTLQSALEIVQNIMHCITSDCHLINLTSPANDRDTSMKDIAVTLVKRLLRLHCARGGRATNITIGSIYGTMNEHWSDAGIQTHIHYDDMFGTVVNRLICQVVSGSFMSVYHNVSGNTSPSTTLDRTIYLSQLDDTITGIDEAIDICAAEGELRHLSLFSEVTSLQKVTDLISDAAQIEGYVAAIQFFKVRSPVTRILSNGPLPAVRNKVFLTVGYIRQMMEDIAPYSSKINRGVCGMPRFE
jgi:UDP-sulfoquinovose synthase